MTATVRKIRGIDTRRRRARVISFDEPQARPGGMWTYVGARRKELGRSVWIWTAVVEETDGSQWMDFEVGGRDRETFMRLYRRLPDARYRSDPYEVYG